MIKENLLNLGLVVGGIGIIVYLKLSARSKEYKEKDEFEKMYVDILNSEQYKVKGKYD